MEKLKPEKKKHNHKLTDFVKVGIFSILLTAPFIAVGVKCGYVMLNKNAKESYYGETINETQYVNVDNTTINDKYVLTRTDDLKQNQNLNYIYCNVTDIRFNTTSSYITFIQENKEYIYRFRVYISGTNYSMEFNLTNANTQYIYIDQLVIIDFYSTQTQNNLSAYSNNLQRIDFNDYSYLDNVFYYSVDELGNNDLFSWTKNTALYNGVNAMTSGLEIDTTNNILALLITYWSLITISYVIIDIVIELFVKLTHFMVE